MTVYYNEIDPHAVGWLRNLIGAGLIADGVVDDRSIEEVSPDDIKGFKQCHFFAGIGVWSYALRQAGWPDDQPVWTGSCPCQPFSCAGNGRAFDDPRHLWPAFGSLISECRPTVVFGEQVASKAVDPWIDLVQDDMEALGYAFGAVAFPSASVGAPHIRDRTYWVANASSLQQRQGWVGGAGNEHVPGRRKQGTAAVTGFCRNLPPGPVNGFWRNADWIECRDGKWRPVEPGTSPLADGATHRVGRLRAYGNAVNAGAAQVFISAFLDTYR